MLPRLWLQSAWINVVHLSISVYCCDAAETSLLAKSDAHNGSGTFGAAHLLTAVLSD